MSIFDELIVAVDDQTELRLDQARALFPQSTYQALSAAFGRLIQRGWLERRAGRETFFRVAGGGTAYIDQMLGAVRQAEQSWPGSWFCLAVSIPSDHRQLRDRLRHYFVDHGYGRLIDSLWISPWNRQAELTPIVRELAIGASVFMFETVPLGPASNQVMIQQAWNWGAIRNRLERYLPGARATVQGIEKLAGQDLTHDGRLRLRLAAKNFVFAYGRLLRSGPNLPAGYSLSRDADREARSLYERIRPLCYR